MSEKPPIQENVETIPSFEEVKGIIDNVIETVKLEEAPTVERQLEDEKGLYAMIIKTVTEGEPGYAEYEYVRAGRYDKNDKHARFEATKTTINVTYFDETDYPFGGTTVARYINNEWKIIT